jgi:hypothetical protein
MSWYNTFVVSFSCGEFEGEKPSKNFAPLKKINSWLKQQGYDDPLLDLTEGYLGSNAILFGGCYNRLDAGAFFDCVGSQPWRYPDDLQVLFWDENASKFTVIEFRPKKKIKAIKKGRKE